MIVEDEVMQTLIQITMFAIAFVVTDKILKSRGEEEMNTDKFAEYATAALFILIGLVVLAITSAVTYRLIMWIIGG